MKINKKVEDILSSNNIKVEDGLCYLLCIYHNIETDLVPYELRKRIHALNIFKINNKDNIVWDIELFDSPDIKFEWVKTEYVVLFKKANVKKGGHVRESKARMKKFFTENPEIRKEDVINATKHYLTNTDYRFIRDPHYFIFKDSGVNRTSDLLNAIEEWQELNKSSKISKMQ